MSVLTEIIAPTGTEEEVGFYRRLTSAFGSDDTLPGKGLDIGTTHVVGVAKRPDGSLVHNAQRNAFIDVRSDEFTRKMLARLDIRRHTIGGRACVIGDPAFVLSNIFEKDVRQPVTAGVVNPGDAMALPMLRELVEQVIGKAKVPGESCAVSMPADPIDSAGNAIYHRGAVAQMLRTLGYTPTQIGQSNALAFSDLAHSDYTGIAVCCGGGSFNVSVLYKSIPAIHFAIARGGDWIDQNVARAIGIPASQACAIKEESINLLTPSDRAGQAISIYCQSLIRYTIEMIREKFSRADDVPSFNRPIPLVCAGGLAQARGFIGLFRRELEEVDFPVPISEVRLARHPTHAVAEGCLSAAEVAKDHRD